MVKSSLEAYSVVGIGYGELQRCNLDSHTVQHCSGVATVGPGRACALPNILEQ